MAEQDKVVLITGGGSGMGREAARRFAAEGAQVVLFDVNVDGMQETAAGFDNVHPHTVDVTDFDAVTAAVRQVEDQIGPVERLYNGAAIMPFGSRVEQDNAIIHKQMAINYGGLVNITQAVLPGMLQRGRGDFVSFASMAGWIPMLKTGAYTATKFAVRAFTETLYHENMKSGVRFACVCPPAVATPLLGLFTLSCFARVAVILLFLRTIREVRRVRPMSAPGLMFRVTRMHPVSGLIYEVVSRISDASGRGDRKREDKRADDD